MTTANTATSPKSLARKAAIGYLLLGIIGAFGMIVVPTTLFVPDNAAETANNILSNDGLFRVGIVARLATQVIQIFTVFALYQLLAPVNRRHAILMVTFILIGVPIAMLNEVLQFAAIFLLKKSAELQSLFSTEQIQSVTALLVDLHEAGIMIAHVFWGLWLFPMGYMVYKSGFIPKFIGVLLMIGCFGYLIDTAIFTLAPDANVTVSQFTFIGELVLPLWLLFMGVNLEGWKKVATTIQSRDEKPVSALS